jgi:hypothetical protein
MQVRLRFVILTLPLMLMGCEQSDQQPSMPPKEPSTPMSAPAPAPNPTVPGPAPADPSLPPDSDKSP